MPIVTVSVDLPDELADKVSALPEDVRAQITAALQNALFALPSPPSLFHVTAPKLSWEELVAAGTGPEAAAKQKALFTEWAAHAAQNPDDELDVETFKANVNDNRRLNGEEAIY